MISLTKKQQYYQALLEKDSQYEGVFYVGVVSTGVFCRPTCPARKPKFENCEFYQTAKEALLAAFRPCKRCQPLSHPNLVSPLVTKLVDAIETNPEKCWKTADLKALGIDDSTARRNFKKRFGMTFLEYARARRMGIAMGQIKSGTSVVDAQLNTGYESGSGFRDAFSSILGDAPSRIDSQDVFKSSLIDTPLGPIIAVADETHLVLLEFIDRRGLEREVERLRKRTKKAIIPGENKILGQIKLELENYFSGANLVFKTPIRLLGSVFQKKVWCELQKISLGETRSYLELANKLNKPTAYRAVANANGANQLALIIPCHRVINTNGELGGYGGGVSRKQWLLEHEKKHVSSR